MLNISIPLLKAQRRLGMNVWINGGNLWIC